MNKDGYLLFRNSPDAHCLSRSQRACIVAFSIAFVVGVIVLKIVSHRSYMLLIAREDSPGQYLTSLVYFISAMISATIASTYFKINLRAVGCAYVFFTIGLFLVAMEEISWGQRIFGIETPDVIAQHNRQGEITLHNMDWFPLHASFMAVGLYGTFAPLLIPSGVKSKYRDIVDALIPDVSLLLYFFAVAALYIYYDYLSQHLVALFGDAFAWGKGRFIHSADQEAAELLLSFGFLLFLTMNRSRLSKRRLRERLRAHLNTTDAIARRGTGLGS